MHNVVPGETNLLPVNYQFIDIVNYLFLYAVCKRTENVYTAYCGTNHPLFHMGKFAVYCFGLIQEFTVYVKRGYSRQMA